MPHTAKGYRSDYDLLVIVNDKRLTDRVDFWERAEDRLAREYLFAKTLKTPVSFIVHSLGEVNAKLAEGRYFFIDIARDGIVLYESDKPKLRRPQPKRPEQALEMAREYFEEWYPVAMERRDIAKFDVSKSYLRPAAFDLHQTTDCILLVLTFYTPSIHNIEHLRNQAERIAPRLFDAWPREIRMEHALFTKLKEAYVKARYSKHYRITEDELAWLDERVEALAHIVQTVCAERLAELEAAASAASS